MTRWILTLVVLFGFAAEAHAHRRITTTITWNREVSRIVFERCASCHNPEGMAFSLMTYAEARPWAVAIKEEALARRMPPWGAVKGFGEFLNEQALTQDQLDLITAWVEGGAPEGDPADLPEEAEIREGLALHPARGARGIVVSGETTLDGEFTLAGLLPERVPEDRPVQIVAELPDGVIEPLLWLYEYDSRFAHAFLLRTPLHLPAGAVIRGVPADSSLILLPADP